MLNSKTVLITGGTGSLGNELTFQIFKKFQNIKKLIIFSRDEQKQYQMAQKYPKEKYPIRYLIGDVRDYERLLRAFNGVDYVIHAAAMKHVDLAEYNPDECIKTNIYGAQNVINAALASKVKKVVALSTDKACSPINLYGATKLTSDKLFVSANNIKGTNPITFSIVRYGNVLGSNGSVIPFFLNKRKEGKELPITDKSMTRFNITLKAGAEMVLDVFKYSWGGEIFIPKIPSYKILDVAKAICPNCKIKIIGIRPGEKIHEEMISESDSINTFDIGKYYVILPSNPNFDLKKFIKEFNAQKVKYGFSYNSLENSEWESIENIRKLIRENIDPNFQ